MAIQMRRGAKQNFDPSRMLPGEWAVVLSGDADGMDGKAVYACFAAGDVKRMATADELYKVAADVGMSERWALEMAELMEQVEAVVGGYVVSVGGHVEGTTLILGPEADEDTLSADLLEARERVAALEADLEACCTQANAELRDTYWILAPLANRWLVRNGELFAPSETVFSVTSSTASVSGTVSSETLTLTT